MTASTVTGRGLGAANQFMLLIKYLESSSVRIGSLDVGDVTADWFTLSDGGWDDLRVGVTSLQKKGTNDPLFTQVRDDGGSSTGVFAWEFQDISNSSLEQELFFEIQMPHSWQEGTSIYPHVHWGPATTDIGTVRWGLEYTIASVNDTFGQTTILYDDAEITEASQYKQLIPAGFGEVDMSDYRISAIILGRLFRNSSHGNDDLEASAFLYSLDWHYQINTLGSSQMLAK